MQGILKRALRTPQRIVLTMTICICVTIIPLLGFMVYSLYQSYELQSQQLVQQRVFGARLAAATVAAELNSIRTFGGWYSQSPRIRALVEDKKWQQLSQDMDRVVEHLPSVVRLFASDSQGRLWADSPRKPDVHGVDFSFRDWFKGVMEHEDVYLSHAYRRTAEPRIQVTSMAFPVLGRDAEIAGVMVFQLSLDTVLSWAANTSLAGYERLIFIDHHQRRFKIDETTGKVVVNATPADQPDLARTLSDVDADVRIQNDEQRVAVYADVAGWPWEVYIAESPDTFFAARDQKQHIVLLVVGLILFLCLIAVGTASVLLRMLVSKERELTQTNTELLNANRNLRDFTHAVSHDLRAPLRGISGFVDALVEDQGEKLDDQSRHYLERIQAGSHKLGHMIDDLLEVARIPQTKLRFEEVDLSRVAQDIIEELRASEPDRSVSVRVYPGLRAKGNPMLLTLVLRNLLNNAWKFTRKCELAEIEFGREQQQGEPVYFVRDNGVGFDAEYANKLFVMFQRLHSEAEFEGTGIGLAAVMQAVALHGGRIWAEGREGEGATFYFTIPFNSQNGRISH